MSSLGKGITNLITGKDSKKRKKKNKKRKKTASFISKALGLGRNKTK